MRYALARMLVWSGLWGGLERAAGESVVAAWPRSYRASTLAADMHTSKAGMILEVMILSRQLMPKGLSTFMPSLDGHADAGAAESMPPPSGDTTRVTRWRSTVRAQPAPVRSSRW